MQACNMSQSSSTYLFLHSIHVCIVCELLNARQVHSSCCDQTCDHQSSPPPKKNKKQKTTSFCASLHLTILKVHCVTFNGILCTRKYICTFHGIKKSLKTKNDYVFHLPVSIYIYIKSRSTCKEGAILRHHVSVVAQNEDLLRFLDFTLILELV